MRRQYTQGRAVVWLLGVCLAVGGAAAYVIWPYWQADREAEVAELIRLLHVQPDMVVGEVGAGDGEMTLAMAKHVGPNGRVISTEIDSEKLTAIREAAASAGLENVTFIEAGEKETNLPPECCDALFMRRVYHHFHRPVYHQPQPPRRLASWRSHCDHRFLAPFAIMVPARGRTREPRRPRRASEACV